MSLSIATGNLTANTSLRECGFHNIREILACMTANVDDKNIGLINSIVIFHDKTFLIRLVNAAGNKTGDIVFLDIAKVMQDYAGKYHAIFQVNTIFNLFRFVLMFLFILFRDDSSEV